MATEQKSTQKVRINPLLSEQGEFALEESRRLYDARAGSQIPSLYTGIDPTRQGALEQMAGLAQGGVGASIANPALAEYQKTLSGGYLDANPYLDEIVRRSVSAAGAAPVSQMVGSGRFGSGVMANAAQDAMQSTAANLYGANYQQERDRMMSMLDRGGMVNDMQYMDANRLAGVGSAYEEDQMRQAAEQMRQYEAEINQLKQFLQLMQGNPLMGERTMRTNTLGLDYGAMAAGGAQILGNMIGGTGSGGGGLASGGPV